MGQLSITINLPNTAATQQLGQKLGQFLPAGAVILLNGNLGSGKTTLVQGLGAGLGIEDAIASPTFTLINEYTEGRVPLYHVDLYRLTPPETDGLYLETYWEGEEVEPGILAIEWADRLKYRPEHPLILALSYGEDGGRQANLSLPNEYVWLKDKLPGTTM